MAYNTQLSNTMANAAVTPAIALANTGFLDVYTATQPASANVAVAGTLLASIVLPATAFSVSNGVCTLLGVPLSAIASATGTAAYFVVYKSDHTTILWEGTVGTTSCNLNLGTTAIASGASVQVNSYAFSIAEANTNG